MTVWHGLNAPAGTPEEIIEKLSKALQAAVQDPKVIERFADLGTVPVPPDQATPAAMDQLLQAQTAKRESSIIEGRRRLRRLHAGPRGAVPLRHPRRVAHPDLLRATFHAAVAAALPARTVPGDGLCHPGTHHRPGRWQELCRHGKGAVSANHLPDRLEAS